jgi:hypothetical protein
MLDFPLINLDGISSFNYAGLALSQSMRTPGLVCPAVCKRLRNPLIRLLVAELTYVNIHSRVTEQSGEFHDDGKNANYPCKDGNNGYDEIYLKETKIKQKKCKAEDVDNSCSAVNENVQRCELLQNLHETDKYPKDKGKKRKRRSKDDRSHVSDEQCDMEQSRCEVVLEGIEHLVEEEKRDRKINKRKRNDELTKLGDISDSVTSVKRASDHIIRPEIPVRVSQENGIVSGIEMGINAETVQDNECLITKNTSTKRRRKRTRRHKETHKLEDKTKGEFTAGIMNPKKETPIRSVAAPRTHIRFSDCYGDVNIDTVNDKVDTIAPQTECEHTYTLHVNGEIGRAHV